MGANSGTIMLAMALWPCAAAAGAWPQAPGHTQLIMPFTVTWATDEYDSEGDAQRRNRFTKQEVQPYLEYGLSRDLTLVGSLALTHERSSWLGTTTSDRALSRVEAGARLALGEWQDTYFSVQPLVIWHGAMTQSDPFASQRGDIDGELALTMGQHFELWGLDGFTDNLVGVRVKPSDRPSELKANLTLGLDLSDTSKVMVKSESYATFTETNSPTTSQITSNKLGLSVVQRLDKTVSMELGYMASLSGKNTIKEQSLGFALWYDF
jgi:hypothetical protein